LARCLLLIQHWRGTVHIVDELGLERLVCEDYQAIQTVYASFLG